MLKIVKEKSYLCINIKPILQVMERVKTEFEKICGVLHNVVEDSDWTIGDLKNEGYPEEVISVVKSLTQN